MFFNQIKRIGDLQFSIKIQTNTFNKYLSLIFNKFIIHLSDYMINKFTDL